MRFIAALSIFFLCFFFVLGPVASEWIDENERTFHSLENALKNPKIVTKLDLSGQELSEFPAAILGLTNLVWLDLSNNRMKKLPVLKDLTKLRMLNINNNQLGELPELLLESTGIEWLYLDSNELTVIPRRINRLINLEVLSLANNSISDLPKELFELKNLRKLNLSQNRIEEIPIQIIKLKNLKRLNLASNRLNTLPSLLENNRRIQILLNYNPIRLMPKVLCDAHTITPTKLCFRRKPDPE